MRRGFVTGGTWCLDRNITVDAWPAEDMVAQVEGVALTGGGCGCNFAVDMRRLDPDMPVETQGLIGTDAAGDFLMQVMDDNGIGRTAMQRTDGCETQVTDAYLSTATGRRTHILFHGTARLLSPGHFDVSQTRARYLHLGLPGIHEVMDAPWQDEANGWVAVLKAAQAAGLKTNLELVSMPGRTIRRLVRPCLAHLDNLVVNDTEIGALAENDTVRDGVTDIAAVKDAARAVLSRGAMDIVVAHYTDGAVLVARDGTVIEQPSVAIPDAERQGANGAGDAFAAGFFLGLHDGALPQDCLRQGHAAAAACLRAPGTYSAVTDMRTCLDMAAHWGWRT